MKRRVDDKIVEVNRLWRPLSVFCIGITWNKKIFLLEPETERERVIRHEMVHKAQQEALGFGKFLFLYIKEWFRHFSYRKNAFEREACFFEDFYRGWLRVDKDSWRRWIYKK